MKKSLMKKIAATTLIIFVLLFTVMPTLVFADTKTPPPAKPYEKVLVKIGTWYTEQITCDNSASLVVGYTGKYQIDDSLVKEEMSPIGFSIREDIVLKGIYLPYVQQAPEAVSIQLQDNKGNIYGPFPTQFVNVNNLKEVSNTGNEGEVSLSQNVNVNYMFMPDNEIVLPSGKYTLTISSPQLQVRTSDTGEGGAFLIKGVNYSANERYKKALQEWEVKNNPEKSKEDAEAKTLGNEEFGEKDLEKYSEEGQPVSTEKPVAKNPAAFSLDGDSLIGEIVLNTYNGGEGATPGIISILDSGNKVIASYQSSGGMLADVPNGIWIITPNIVLPAGNYFIGIFDPSVITYDELGDPEFIVTIMIPPSVRYDFTGTYSINLNTYKTSTLMGPVTGQQPSSFSLENFELTILDKDGELELIGQYEGMPFSQGCTIVEETEDTVVAEFAFAADLSKLPYKARIGAQAVVTLTKPKNAPAKINIDGTATYDRGETKDKGADSNTYSLVVTGALKQKDLPPFVMTALGQYGNAGNIPGPDSPVQGATGLLFPPLVGVVVHVIQELLKPKDKVPSGPRDKNWYKKKYPGKTDEQLAMIMMADALGNSDEPDDDPESIGDNEKSGGADYVSSERSDGGYSAEEDSYETSSDDGYERDDEPDTENSESESAAKEQGTVDTQKGEQLPEQPEPSEPAEPETLVLQTDHKGGTTEYVKDPETGEWVNPYTGGVLDMEKYNKDVVPNFQKDKEFINKEFEKNTKGETEFDKIVRDSEKQRQEQLAKAEYLNKLEKQYGTKDPQELEKIIKANQEKSQAEAESWTKIGDVMEAGEKVSGIVGTVSDGLVDGLANMTGPAGKGIQSTYKVAKGILGTMAEKGVSTSSFVSGAVKGGTDAATDYVKNPYVKAGLTIGGEVVGEALTAKDPSKGAWDGLVSGTAKVAVGTITDKIGDKLGATGFGNDTILTTLKDGKVRVAVKSGEKWVGRVLSASSTEKFIGEKVTKQVGQTMLKYTTGAIDETVLKPYIVDPVKDMYK